MDKLKLTELVNSGMTQREISKQMNCSQTNIKYWMKKYDLKSKNFQIGQNNFYLSNRYKEKQKNNLNWKYDEIQKSYDSGLPWREVSKIHKISVATIFLKIKEGFLKSRNLSEAYTFRKKDIPQKHTEETKKKISEARKKYLKENGGNPWVNKTMVKTSPPCENFKNFLRSKGITFEEEFMPLKHKNRFFSIDIAFPDKKIGIEINGNQHYNSDRSLAKYYQERHNLIVAEGWILFEIPSKRCFSEESMNQVLNEICLK
jgi:hypothetical protein